MLHLHQMICTVCFFKAVQTVNPPNGSVGSSQIAASIITGQTALGATPADTDELLISDAGTLKRVDYSYLKSANTPAFEAYLSSDQTGVSDNSATKVEIDTELFDTDGCYDNSTNYRFTPTTAGKYFVYASVNGKTDNAAYLTHMNLYIYKNGSLYKYIEQDFRSANAFIITTQAEAIIDMNGSSDYLEVYGVLDYTSGAGRFQANTKNTYFGAYKLIGV